VVVQIVVVWEFEIEIDKLNQSLLQGLIDLIAIDLVQVIHSFVDLRSSWRESRLNSLRFHLLTLFISPLLLSLSSLLHFKLSRTRKQQATPAPSSSSGLELALASGAGPLTQYSQLNNGITKPNKTTARSVPAFLNKLFT